MVNGIGFGNCTSGSDFEHEVCKYLASLGYSSKRTGANDGGVDIITWVKTPDKTLTFYIQCKFYNKELGKHPIQEIYTGAKYYAGLEDGVEGTPVLITNNRVTYKARVYAKSLGVEIIADTEWDELAIASTEQEHYDNPITYKGLMGFMMSSILNRPEYYQELIKPEEDVADIDKERFAQSISNDFDEAEECAKEAAYLRQKADKYSQRAIKLQKEAILRNLKYI